MDRVMVDDARVQEKSIYCTYIEEAISPAG